MGPTPARRKGANIGQMPLAAGPIPGSAIQRRLINSVGFDKAALPRPVNNSPQTQTAKSPAKRPGSLFLKSASASAQIPHKFASERATYWWAAAGVNFA